MHFTDTALIRTLAVSPALAASVTNAAGIDLHRMWDDRCFECHGHAGLFARDTLSVTDGRLRGRHHVDDLRGLMQHHYLAGNEVDAVLAMLRAQTTSEARFRQACSSCHAGAAEFVRDALVLREGTLVSRETAQPTRAFLAPSALDRHRCRVLRATVESRRSRSASISTSPRLTRRGDKTMADTSAVDNAQVASGIISMAPHGHSATHMPHPLQ